MVEADLLIHVVDASAADPEAQMDAVRTVLREIGADEVPELIAFNKADLAGDEAKRLPRPPPRLGGGGGRDRRRHRRPCSRPWATRLRTLSKVVELVVPYDRGDVVAAVHRHGEVLSEAHDADATRLRARLEYPEVHRFAEFLA